MKRQPILRTLKRFAPTVAQILVVVAILITAFVAYNLGARSGGHETQTASATTRPAEEMLPVYTCSMHPQIRQNEPGDCPICGMELVLAETEDPRAGVQSVSDHSHHAEPEGYACAMNCLPPLEEPGPCPICGMEMQPVFSDSPASSEPRSARQLVMSPEAVALSRIQTSVVERRPATRSVRLVGQLSVDPRGRTHISANVGGRIDELHARFEGDRVEAGQLLVSIYSPELWGVQREFLQAIQSAQRTSDTSFGQIGEATVSAMRERLRLAGLSPEQIEAIARDGVTSDRLELNASTGGIVIARYVEEGEYVEREARILTVADLSTLWAEMEAFESDLQWLRVGQSIQLTSEVFPGESFNGEVAWIDPVTNPATRTTRIRVDVDNAEELLKPGMYMRGALESTIPGEIHPLIVPDTAPLITGKRAVVYVETPDAERPTFEGREIVLGSRVDDGYIVLEGLAEGDRVVTHGAFRIDSALQIIARPSMMSPEGGRAMTGHEGHGIEMPAGESDQPTPHAEEHVSVSISPDALGELLTRYLAVHEALADDDFETASASWSEFAGLAPGSGDHDLHADADAGSDAADIGALRVAFEPVSDRLIAALRVHGNPLDQQLYLVHCPMTFEWKGSHWIQTGDDVRNPYFGDQMYRCGGIEEEFPPR